jgi:hypothetical protein
VDLYLPFVGKHLRVSKRSAKHFFRARVLRQGDPSLPFLFDLAMQVLTAAVAKAIKYDRVMPIGRCTASQRMSMYVYYVVIFVKSLPSC